MTNLVQDLDVLVANMLSLLCGFMGHLRTPGGPGLTLGPGLAHEQNVVQYTSLDILLKLDGFDRCLKCSCFAKRSDFYLSNCIYKQLLTMCLSIRTSLGPDFLLKLGSFLFSYSGGSEMAF